jgi:hypothetical protein
MLGRALFALVCVIIATGLLLPVYPTEVATPGSANGRDMLISDSASPGCAHCGAAAANAAMHCGRGSPGAATTHKACIHLTVYLVVRPLPVAGDPGDPQLLPPKLPTI